MFEEILSKNAKNALALLGESGILEESYLAGGTALALQIGHRLSYDFDFFTDKVFNEKIVIQKLFKIARDFKLERESEGTILASINGVRFSLFFYIYPLLFETKKFLNINIAEIKDIAPMKIAAISDRGAKRDFIDLYFILKIKNILSLKDVLELYDKKFKKLDQNKLHIIKSLIYFEDAEQEEMSKMLKTVSWKNVKKFFKDEIKKLDLTNL